MAEVLRFKLARPGGNSSNAAEFLRELADMCDQLKVNSLAVFFSDGDEDAPTFHFHHLLGGYPDVVYGVEAAKHAWIQESNHE